MADPLIPEVNKVKDIHAELSEVLALATASRNVTKGLNDIYAQINRHLGSMTDEQRLHLDLTQAIERSILNIKILEAKRLAGQLGNTTAYAHQAEELSKINLALELQYNLEKLMKENQKEKLKGNILERAGLTKLASLWTLIKTLTAEHPGIVILAAVGFILEQVAKLFFEIDESAAKFRMSMGQTRNDSKQVEVIARELAESLNKVGVSAMVVHETYLQVAKTIGTTQIATTDIVKDISLMNSQLGITQQASVDFLRTMGMFGRSTMDAQKNMLLITAKMSEAAGIPLDDVMRDIEEAAKSGYSYLSRDPLALAKSAIEAKRLGTSLQSTVTTSKGLLEFTSSVQAEMEASVLLGKSLNLQYARELAFRGKTAELNEEILRLTKDTKFESLDPITQGKVAAAFGKSAEEIAKMLQMDRDRETIMNNPALRKQREELDRMLASTRNLADADANRLRLQLQQESNQSRLTSLSNSWHQILYKLGEIIFPLIDKPLAFVADHLEEILEYTASIYSLFKLGMGIGKWIAPVAAFTGGIVDAFVSLGGWIGKFIGLSGSALRFFGVFGKAIPIIGQVITGVVFLINLVKRFQEMDWSGTFLTKILKGLSAVGGAIYDTLLQPFIDVYHWIAKHLGANSPSEIGLMIVKGIVAVEDMILNALLSPFTSAWNLIKKIPFISKWFGGADQTKLAEPIINADMAEERSIGGVNGFKGSGLQPLAQDNPMMKALIDKIDELNSNLKAMRDDFKNGGILATVNLDGQKVDSVLARTRAFRGELNPV
jgi:hypothetical protein